MNKGDILFVYKDILNESKPYIIYDRNIAIGTTLAGISLLNINTLSDKLQYKVITIAQDISWQKKKKLNEFMTKLITKQIVPSFKERLNFLKYLTWIYEKTINVRLLDNPVPITLNNILESDKIIIC